jgi:LssY C-terminus
MPSLRKFMLSASLALLALAGATQAGSQDPDPTPKSKDATVAKPKEKLTVEQILEKLPRRVASKSGALGDMVNFILVGSQDQMIAALSAAGWMQVDRSTEDAIQHAITDMLEHRAYGEMPMSELYLLGRPQDFGWAEGIPLQTIRERNHFRLWETPWETPEGQTVWAGAGTHDIGIKKDEFGNLTHQIDPNVDQERDFIAGSLQDAKKTEQTRYVKPSNPVLEAVTTTGGAYHSDGRIAVIFLK